MRGFSLILLAASAHALNASLHTRALSTSFPLRILCVGDSITWGVEWDGSPTPDNKQDGYRYDLYNLIVSAGVVPEFVGTQISGDNIPQPEMEGYPGNTINQILNNLKTDHALDAGPNVVLIHAGTNDNDFPPSTDPALDPTLASYRLGTMIDYVLCQVPDAVVLVAQLIENQSSEGKANTANFNSQVPGVVAERYEQGYKVMAVNMDQVQGPYLMADALHPNQYGYTVMADIWFYAMSSVPSEWWSAPQTSRSTFYTNVAVCDRHSISFSPLLGGQPVTAGFHANGDSPDPPSSAATTKFFPSWNDDGITFLGLGWPGSGVKLIDLNGDGRTDWLWINYTQGEEGSVYAWLNEGPDQWSAVNNGAKIAFGYPGTSYVELADLDGDKMPELIYIADGLFKIYKNGGQVNNDVWGWGELPQAEGQLNYIFVDSAPLHWFADLTGDGLADLIVVNNNQVLDMYINDGPDGNGGFKWTQCLEIGISANGQTWTDIDGDGKADFVSIDSSGGASGYFNRYAGGCSLNWTPINGGAAESLAFNFGTGVLFADMNQDGKADYNSVDAVGNVHTWINQGYFGPTESSIGGWASAVRLNDMDGDGFDDYVAVTGYSGMGVAINGGQNQNGNSWIFNPVDNGQVIALGFPGGTRHQVHLADMNGDGRDDYLYIDDDTGAVHCYLNLGASSSSWNWDIMGEIAIGVGGVGAGVRIADFDADGRADYIYVNDDGSASVWLNKGPGDFLSNWQNLNNHQVSALGVGANQADVHFADIDGDQKADYIWVHPDTGDMQVWFNLWDGTHVGWIGGDTLLSGTGYPGKAIQFGRISSGGRHDYCALDEDTGAIKVFANNCNKVVGSATAPVAGHCGTAPLPTKTTAGPVFTPPAITVSSAVCTSTYDNGAMVVYQYDEGGKIGCAGASRTVFNGQQLTIKIEATASAQVNSVTGAELFTSVSNALMAACTPPPAAGVTVSSCGPASAVPSIACVSPPDGDHGTITRDGSLEINLPYVRYSTDATRQALINAIAGVLNSSSLAATNHVDVTYGCYNNKNGEYCPQMTIATVPAIVEAIYTQQDLDTSGRLRIENIEAQFTMIRGSDGGNYACEAAGLTEDGLGSLGSLYALEHLGLDDISTFTSPLLSLTCLLIDATERDEDADADSTPGFGNPVYASETVQPTPTFQDWAFTATGARNSGTTLYKSSVTMASSGFWPTDPPQLVLAVGASIQIEAATSRSVTVGTYDGNMLASSLASILSSACPSPSGTTVTACAAPAAITGVYYKMKPDDDTNEGYGTDGEIDVVIPLAQYSTDTGWRALINSTVGVFNMSASMSGNSRAFSGLCDIDNQGESCSGTLYQVGDSAQTIYATQDDSTNGTLQLELLQVRLEFEKPGEADNALVCDSVGLASSLLGILAIVPGLEWLGFVAAAGPLADITCADLSGTGD